MFKATTPILPVLLTVVACSPHDQGQVGTAYEAATTILVGDSTAYSQGSSVRAGVAEAWRYTATTSGTATKLNVCVSPRSGATRIYVGLYASNGQGTLPSSLLARATITSPVPGFNAATISPVTITAGTRYWLAVLSPQGDRTATLCAVSGASQYGARVTATTSLTSLPSTYPSSGTTYSGRTAGIFASFTQSGGGAGGAPGAGGQPATGGAASGGTPGAGGAASGGAPGAGGAAAGGKPATGGAASGGTPGAGGAGAGGKPASGGSSGSGTGSYIRQFNETHVVYPTSQDISVSLPMPVLQGSAIVVFANEFYIDASAPPRTITVKDSTGASFTQLSAIGDIDSRSQAAALSFVRANAPAGAMTVTAHYVYDTDWDAVVVAEVAGVSANPLLASAAQVVESGNQGVDSATSGPMTFSTAPALVIGYSVSGRAIFGPPKAGTGFTTVGTAVNWAGVEGTANQPSALLESRRVTSAGTVAATATPGGGSPPSPDRLLTLGIVLRE